jgi:hypothetical protein
MGFNDKGVAATTQLFGFLFFDQGVTACHDELINAA